MKVISEIGLADFEPWAGAKYAHERILEEGKAQWFEDMIEDIYPEGLTDTELNDLLWFDRDWIYEALEIDPDED